MMGGWPVPPERRMVPGSYYFMPDLLELIGAFEPNRAQMPLPNLKRKLKNKVTNYKSKELVKDEARSIVAMYKRGHTYEYIKDFLKIGGKKISEALRDANIVPEVMDRNRAKVKMPELEELKTEYAVNNLRGLSITYGTTIANVKLWLKHYGIKLKKRRGRRG